MKANLVVNGEGVVEVMTGLIEIVATPGLIFVTDTGQSMDVVIVFCVAGNGEHVTTEV